jgi:hypothetical protein
MASGENETVAIEPARLVRIVSKSASIKNRANICRAERKAQMTGFAFGNSVHGKTARIAGRQFKVERVEYHGFKGDQQKR